MMHILSIINLDTYFMVGGTIAGAIIASSIGYFVSKTEINYREKHEAISEINSFFKVHKFLKGRLDRAYNLLGDRYEERFDGELPLSSLSYHMKNYLNRRNDSILINNHVNEYAYEHLKQIINIRDEFHEIYESLKIIDDTYIPKDYYENYLNLLSTLKNIVKYIDKFLYHDDIVPKDNFQTVLNTFYETNHRNRIVQNKMASNDKTYLEFLFTIDAHQKALQIIYDEKTNKKEKLSN